MPGRLPAPSDFPAHLHLNITLPPPHNAATNVLVLLHGLGDTKTSFTKLAENLSLPDTVCLSLEAPTPLPFDLGGYHWGDDILFDQTSGLMLPDAGFTKTTNIIANEVLQDVLISQCGYRARFIFFLGFGQGGMTALSVATARSDELGGVISIGGPLPSAVSDRSKGRSRTPVLVLGGSSVTCITASTLAKVKEVFLDVEYKKWSRSGDAMPRTREEMLPVMKFLARRLCSRRGVPEGSIEVG
ncbi:MAG: hypothetical protein M1817_005162 [Caeruleum heppii]|nr:MAG: hypothetical protein M1817_005162 [Caeruleum heppii]